MRRGGERLRTRVSLAARHTGLHKANLPEVLEQLAARLGHRQEGPAGKCEVRSVKCEVRSVRCEGRVWAIVRRDLQGSVKGEV